uniref:Uncharacterized protein n=1 Tax=Lygus hesperus TaxID=30085 RepID=A0A0A9XQG3_LYGHE
MGTVHYAIFFLFIILGVVTYISALVGSYQEEIYPMKIATGFLCAQAVLWLVLTIFSFVEVHDLSGLFCVAKMRCADRFFITNANWSYAEVEPEYFFNFYPSTNPDRRFRTMDGCLNYCHSLKSVKRTKTNEATITTEETTKNTPSETTEETTVTTDNSKTTEDTETTTGRTEQMKESTNVTEKPKETTKNVLRDLNLDEDDSIQTDTYLDNYNDSLEKRVKRQGTSKINASTTINSTTSASTANTSTTTTSTTSASTTTTSSTINSQSCECSKSRVTTLLGPLGNISHLIISVLYAILILVFWYGYCFCIFLSYINFLKIEESVDETDTSRAPSSRSSDAVFR